MIFKMDDKSQCYNYHFNNCSKYYFCTRCKLKNISVTAKLHKDDETGEQYIVLGSREHLCEPVKYEAEKEIIKAPNFMVINENNSNKLTKLIVFTSSAKDLYYEYIFQKQAKCFHCMLCNYKNKCVSAKLLKDRNGIQSVQLFQNNHICTPQKYVTEKFQPKTV